jgi:hypothetical protein
MGLSGIGSFLNGFYTWLQKLPAWKLLLLGVLITPGMMFIIGWVFESRTLAISIGQSKMFMPGDFFLALILLAAVKGIKNLPKHGWWQRSWWPILVIVTTTTMVILMRVWLDAPNYAPRAAMSPTKIYHDVMCYGIYAPIIAVVGLPVLFSARGKRAWLCRVGILLGLAVWLTGGIYDSSLGGFAFMPEVRHPANWEPIWYYWRG